jgi:dTMP kinase
MNTFPGILIVFDGIDGAGKTTQVRLLERALTEIGENVIVSKEPTDGQWGRKLRESAFSGRMPFDEELDAFIKDRQEHLNTKIIPALEAGSVVILDRYFYSTIAYQGILVSDHTTIEAKIRADVVVPDVAFWMDLPTSLAVSRVQSRDGALNMFERQDDLAKAAVIFKSISETDPVMVRLDSTLSVPLLQKAIIDNLLSGALKAKRCAKAYGCDDPYYCLPRMTNSCDWWSMKEKLSATAVL